MLIDETVKQQQRDKMFKDIIAAENKAPPEPKTTVPAESIKE